MATEYRVEMHSAEEGSYSSELHPTRAAALARAAVVLSWGYGWAARVSYGVQGPHTWHARGEVRCL